MPIAIPNITCAKLFLRRILVLFSIFVAIVGANGQAAWTTANPGNWSNPATWTANAVPPAAVSMGTVTLSHSVTLDQNAIAGTLNITAGTLTVSGSNTLSVTGTATIASGAVFTNSGSNAANITISNFVVSNGGTYNHNAVGSSANGASTDFPGTTRSFGASSNVVITKWAQSGATTPAPLPASGNPGWGNLTISLDNSLTFATSATPYSNGVWNQFGNLTDIQGNFSVTRTGTVSPNEFRFFGQTTNASLVIKGDVSISGGRVAMIGDGFGSGKTVSITVKGNFTLSGSSTFDLTSSYANLGGFHNTFLYLEGNLLIQNSAKFQRYRTNTTNGIGFVKPSGIQSFSSHATGLHTGNPGVGFRVGNGTTTNTLKLLTPFLSLQTVTGTFPNLGNRFEVYPNATLECSDENYMQGWGFTTAASSTLKISSKDGIEKISSTAKGSIRMISTTYGTMYHSGANYIYTGAYNQVTGNGLPATISGSLTTANSGAVGNNLVTLSSPITVTGKLSLQDGLFTTGTTNLLTLSSAGTLDPLASGSNESFVNGAMARGTNTKSDYTFPVGKTGGSKTWRPVSVIPASTSASTFLAEYFYGPTPNNTNLLSNITSLENNEYWNINRTAGTTNAVVKLNYENPGSGTGSWTPVDPCAACHVGVAQYNNTGAGYWDFTKNSVDFDPAIPETRLNSSNGPLHSATVTSFSLARPFTAAAYYDITLPVRLLSFTAKLLGKDGLIDWQIASCADLAGFELQHSGNGRDFATLAGLPAANNNAYHYQHRQLAAGTHFYRLLVKEKDGRSFYSQVVILMVGSLKTRIIGLANNPVTDRITPMILSAGDQKVEAIISDAVGRALYRRQGQLKTGQNQWPLSAIALPSNELYFITIITADGESATLKFFKE